MLRKLLAAAALSAMMVQSAVAADSVRIGVITTLTTGAASLGEEQMRAFNLALEHIGSEMAGLPVELVVEDDGFNPETGKQAADKLVTQENVDFVTGLIWSHVMLAARKSIIDSGTFMISANAGASPLAGELCHENFFSTSWQNDQVPMAIGEVLNQREVSSIYIMSPNYKAGKDMVAGVQRTFTGEVLGIDYTRWGADMQLDFQAELAEAAASGAESLFIFYPGRAGPAFVQQFHQAGLGDVMDLYTVFTLDAIALPKFQEAGLDSVLGAFDTMHWSPDLDNAQNNRFVADFREQHGRYPTFYAAQAYDTIFFIKAAVEAVNGDLDDMDGMRAAMESANYDSVRGTYAYGSNHMPVQNFYLREIVVGDDGNWTHRIAQTVYEDHADPHGVNCAME
jgi:branched-chain amino acid transport system substrate-binding protein